MNEEMMTARTEAICEIEEVLRKSSVEAMKRHGNDPHAMSIMLSAITIFIGNIDKHVDPGFQQKMVLMLSPAHREAGA